MTTRSAGWKRFPAAQAAALEQTMERLRALLPHATEAIAWGMPTLKIEGVSVIAVEGFSRHNSLFPMSGAVPGLLKRELAGYRVSKGTIQFPLDEPVAKGLLRAIVSCRIDEINAGYPKANGEFKEFYRNGGLKAAGRMKDGAMTGPWRWQRQDGSLMRTGSFTAGEQTGEWVTYAADGRVVKRTQFGGGKRPRRGQ